MPFIDASLPIVARVGAVLSGYSGIHSCTSTLRTDLLRVNFSHCFAPYLAAYSAEIDGGSAFASCLLLNCSTTTGAIGFDRFLGGSFRVDCSLFIDCTYAVREGPITLSNSGMVRCGFGALTRTLTLENCIIDDVVAPLGNLTMSGCVNGDVGYINQAGEMLAGTCRLYDFRIIGLPTPCFFSGSSRAETYAQDSESLVPLRSAALTLTKRLGTFDGFSSGTEFLERIRLFAASRFQSDSGQSPKEDLPWSPVTLVIVVVAVMFLATTVIFATLYLRARRRDSRGSGTGESESVPMGDGDCSTVTETTAGVIWTDGSVSGDRVDSLDAPTKL